MTRFDRGRIWPWVLLIWCVALPVRAADDQGLKILLTNDDGWNAPGIVALHEALTAAGHAVVRVAPERNRSGSGSSTNTDVGSRVSVRRHDRDVWSVDGTPTDAVRAALGALMPDWPDLVISGANFGQNIGRGTLHISGTVGAALYAAEQGLPAIAVSVGLDLTELNAGFPSTMASFAPAAAMVRDLVANMRGADGLALGKGRVLNINVPVPAAEVRGAVWTRPGGGSGFDFSWRDPGGVRERGAGELVIELTPRLGFVPAAGTDVAAFNDGYVTMSLLDGAMWVEPDGRLSALAMPGADTVTPGRDTRKEAGQ